uniref:Uncharacterized protein n=1 Tax=Angiostrongylus cantonensis TaxID=6313 RepID=A0A0K0D0L4_ANGCA
MSRPECESVVSDLFVFELGNVCGVREADGLPIRFAKLTLDPISDPTMSDRLSTGEFECLSSDGFCEDIDFAKNVNRAVTEISTIIEIQQGNQHRKLLLPTCTAAKADIGRVCIKVPREPAIR